MSQKMWSINVFGKEQDGNYSKDLYGPKYKWSYDDYQKAKAAFDSIPAEGQETSCELMEYDFQSKELKCIETKFSNPFAGQYIIPGNYQHEIG